MNFSFFVAKRYYFSKQSKSIINIITRIAILGLMVSTAAMVIVLSAFNGIESLVHDLYSDFDPHITITSKKGKTVNADFIPIDEIQNIDGVSHISKQIEEIVIIKHGNKWVNGTLLGVEPVFYEMIKLKDHLIQGHTLSKEYKKSSYIGIGLLNKLDGIIFESNPERILVYAPSRDAKIMRSSNPFKSDAFLIDASVNYNREVNSSFLIVPLEAASDLLGYEKDITRLAVNVNDLGNLEKIREEIALLLGSDFEIKTHLEKNELIYKTSKIEKIIVFCILIFIFALATFNMVASLTMLFIEKTPNLKTLKAIGLTERGIFSIFFKQGLLISGSGIVLGLLFGYIIVSIQFFGAFLTLPNSGGEAFPVVMSVTDSLLIVGVTGIIGVLSSWLPVSYLVRKSRKSFN